MATAALQTQQTSQITPENQVSKKEIKNVFLFLTILMVD